jgi:hypothetical protein
MRIRVRRVSPEIPASAGMTKEKGMTLPTSSFPRRRESTRSPGPNLAWIGVCSPVDSRLRGNDGESRDAESLWRPASATARPSLCEDSQGGRTPAAGA